MRHFKSLRTEPWEPEFFVASNNEYAVAAKINVWHDDFPHRVDDTEMMIVTPFLGQGSRAEYILPSTLQNIHERIFSDTHHAGKWREVNVTVGGHRPPDYTMIPKFMNELFSHYAERFRNPLTFDADLIDWYHDFETIHPFEDGNGRVGGVTVARLGRRYSDHMLAPMQ